MLDERARRKPEFDGDNSQIRDSAHSHATVNNSGTGAVMPLGWILLQQPQNKVFERRREIVLMRREQFGLIVKNRVRNRDLLITTEWLSSREHLIEHYPERPQVGTCIHVLTADLLRRHIGYGSEANTGFTATMIARFGQSKVEDPHGAGGQEHDVARLQVAVHDSGDVCSL